MGACFAVNNPLLLGLLVFVLCILLYIFAFAVMRVARKENYVDSSPTTNVQERYMTFFNAMACRNIMFPYLNNISYLASERAIKDTSVASNTALCRIVNKPHNLNESYAIVQENVLFYNLKYTCIQCRYKTATQTSVTFPQLPGVSVPSFKIAMKLENATDVENLAVLLKLNSIFVEFDANSSLSSVAYTLSYPNLSFSNDGIVFPSSVLLTFNQVVGKNDPLFDYSKYNMTYQPLDVVLSKSKSDMLNMRAFFLDEIKDSFQSVGRRIPLTYSTVGRSLVFAKDYAKYATTDERMYEFCNNTAIWWRNFVSPVFTFEFDITVKDSDSGALKGTTTHINKVYMNNNVGLYTDCTTVIDRTGVAKSMVKSNNIMSVFLTGIDATYFALLVTTGAAKKCVGTNGVQVKVPFLKTGASSSMHLRIMVTPTEKIVHVDWISPSQEKKYAFAKATNCDPSSRNSLYELFVQQPRAAINVMQDIYMDYDVRYVKKVDSVSLGY